LGGMSVGELGSLFRHSPAYLGDSVADGHDRGSTGGVQVALAPGGEDKAAFTADSPRIRLQEISRKDGVTHCPILVSTTLMRFCMA
jgi:hypothetical protein